MKLRWSSIDGTSWRAMTENGFIGLVAYHEELGEYSLHILSSTDESLNEIYETSSRATAEKVLLERAGLL